MYDGQLVRYFVWDMLIIYKIFLLSITWQLKDVLKLMIRKNHLSAIPGKLHNFYAKPGK